MDETIAAIEAEVNAKLNRRAEDYQAEFDSHERRESTVITSMMPRTMAYLPRTKNAVIIASISLLLLIVLVVLIVLMLRTP